MKLSTKLSSLLVALGAVAAPGLAHASDDPTSVTFTALETCNYGGPVTFKIGNTVVGTVASKNECTCNPSGTVSLTVVNPAHLALIGPPGCTNFGVSVSSNYLAYARATVTRSVSGAETVCIKDFAGGGTCGDRAGNNLCAGYGPATGAGFTNGLPDADADGIADCSDPDRDNDGVLNAADNCPNNANAGQADSDGNGTGDACQPNVVAVPWLGSEAKSHEVYSGGAIVLQAVASNPAGDALTLGSATWDAGDGSGPTAISVSNSLALEKTHTYTGAVGQPFTATIRVTDATGNVYTDTMKVVIKPNVRETKVNMAIDKGLWNLHKRMQRTTSDGTPSGFWTGYSTYHFAASAGAIQAFEINGHRQSGDATKNPYVNNVARGLRYILSQQHGKLMHMDIGLQGANDPDANGNGYGLGVNIAVSSHSHSPYVGGQFMDALIASGTPNEIAVTGEPVYVRGRTYKDIMKDMLDGYSWGMNDGVGGWHYDYNSGGNDSSASHWWAIGVLAAEVWNLDAPAWVKTLQWSVGVPLMQRFDDTARAANQCWFGYTNSTSPLWDSGTNTTAAGLILMNADDIPKTNARWTCAENYLNSTFNSSMGNFYTMYQTAKAMRTALDAGGATSPVVLMSGTRDWYAAYADHLIANQIANGTGRFTSTAGQTSSYITDDMASSWAIIILSPSLFEQPPTAACSVDSNLVCQAGAVGGCNTTGADPYAVVNVDGTASTPGDNPIASYSWNFQDGSPLDSNVVTSHSWSVKNTYNVTLTVTDTKGNASSVVCPVQVTDQALPPVADAGGPYRICQGDSLMLNGTGSFGRGSDIVAYAWDWTAPINFAAVDSTAAITGDVGSSLGLGTHSVGLKVTDGANQSTTNFTEITVIAANDPSCNHPPVAVASSEDIVECSSPAGTEVALNGSDSSDPDGQTLSYSWSADDVVDSVDGASLAMATATAVDLGTHSFTLTVTDPKGATDTDVASFTVVDTTPPELTLNPSNPATGDVAVTLECGQSYTEYGAEAGDLCCGAADLHEPVVPADMSAPGGYSVSYTADDCHGKSTTAAREVTVLSYFDADNSVLWHQPIARNGMSDDTDPSLQADGDPATNLKYRFATNSTIPVQVHLLDKAGNDVTADQASSARVTVYSDINCNNAVDGGDASVAIAYNGVGGTSGQMVRTDGHFKYNLNCKSLPALTGCFILEVTSMTSGSCNDTATERVLLQRK